MAGERKREWADVLESGIDGDELLLLKFLHAYMPLHDLADYGGAFFLEHVRQTLKVREQMPWGGSIPDELFVHFVLPYRVNNENIDNSREVIFGELYSRVKDLTMTEAVLETNYWCHEQATYIGTDMRTVSPLTIMRTGLGRCGEQSTLAVAALRSIGIPARQVYTPRWAHCDSNHAWVEAWADGEWRFLGACEPEPILNEGWFRSPSRQAMLVNTRVAADYRGPEEICSDHPWYAEINMLDRYAPVKTITVQVKDKNGMPAEAEVQFQVYNFAEFSTIVTKTTDAGGNVSLMTGLGDLLVHARGPLGWGTRKIDVRDGVWFDLTLGEHPAAGDIVELEMVPPAADTGAELEVPEEKRTRHEERVKEGTQIRAGFEAEFRAAIKGGDLARELGLSEDRVLSVLDKARGNAAELARFLKEAAAEERKLALRLLESLREKDLTDTFVPTLADHLEGTRGMDDGGMKPEFF
ncbi:transglutaminase-like domain-containing protein [Paenibacillus sp. DMB20]|uniref:transglutaminase-like domain-containing protein n=1 Tax=Paenibacillus sp. DMB20 TaxID=1642570 RepID=UPI00069BFBCB|nr:transglutaminase-like domain-containing protein [Paenibacillus sp. DMB20]